MRRAGLILGLIATSVAVWLVLGYDPRTREPRRSVVAPKPAAPPSPVIEIDEGGEERDEEQGPRTTTFHVWTGGGCWPVEGATVTLPDHEVSRRTDESGAVAIVHPYDSPRYIVRKVGYHTVEGRPSWVATVDVQLVEGLPASGHVVLAGTTASAHRARVWIRADERHGDLLDATTTDANGRYTVAALDDERPVRIAANLPGFAPVEVKVRGRPLPDIVLGEGGVIEGRVLDAKGQPLPDAVVLVPRKDHAWLMSRAAWEEDGVMVTVDLFLVPHVRTDAEGRFRVRGLRLPASYSVIVLCDTGDTVRHHGIRLFAHRPSARVDMVVQPAATLVVRLSSAGGTDVSGARVDLTGLDNDGHGIHLFGRNAGGSWRFENLMAGPYELGIDDDGHVSQDLRVTLAPGETRAMNVTLGRGLRVGGIVVDRDGGGVPGIEVEFRADRRDDEFGYGRDMIATSVTEEDGTFEIRGMVNRPGRVVTSGGGSGRRFAPTITTEVRPGDSDLRIVVRHAARIVGRVTPTPGSLAVACRWFWKGRFWGDSPQHKYRNRAHFKVDELPIETPITATLQAEGFAPMTITVAPLEAGETRDLGTIRLGHGITLSGTVRDAHEVPIPDAGLVVFGADARARSDREGRFRIRNLVAKETRVWVTAAGFVSRLVTIPAEATGPVSIVLSRGGRLVARVFDADDDPAEDSTFTLSVSPADNPDHGAAPSPRAAEGATYAIRLEPGDYVLKATWSMGSDVNTSRQPFSIRDGQDTKVDIWLR